MRGCKRKQDEHSSSVNMDSDKHVSITNKKKQNSKSKYYKKSKDELIAKQSKLQQKLQEIDALQADLEKKQEKLNAILQNSETQHKEDSLLQKQIEEIRKKMNLRKQALNSFRIELEKIKTQLDDIQKHQQKLQKQTLAKIEDEKQFEKIKKLNDEASTDGYVDEIESMLGYKNLLITKITRIRRGRAKLTILALACTAILLISGFHGAMLYGTQYMQSKTGYLYSISSAADWWDCNWSYCKKITIDHNKVDTDQTNYPVMIYRSTDSDLATYTQSDGADIAFLNQYNTTQYNHEIEKYDSSTGELIAWVKVTSVSSTTDTILYMYYGNPTSSNQTNMVETWDSNYVMVHHLEDPSGTIVDSTSSYNNGTNNGAAFNATSKIDGGYDFDGNDNITVSDASSLDITGQITLEGWIKDPPWIKDDDETIVQIIDKREENRLIIPGQELNVERTVRTNKQTDLIFVALYSSGIKIQNMYEGQNNILEKRYKKDNPNSNIEKRIENIRKQLPDKLKELENIAYSKTFTTNSEKTIKMSFESKTNNLFNDGKISYLVISSDGVYDYESTTHLELNKKLTNKNYNNSKFLTKSLVENISTQDWLLSLASLDQIGHFDFNAKAKKSTSSGSGDISLASGKNCAYSPFLTKLTTVCNNLKMIKNCISDKENRFNISSLCLSNSSNAKLGEYKIKEDKVDNSRAFDFSLKKENKILVSTINRIQNNPCFLRLLNLPRLIFLPNSTKSSSPKFFAPFISSSMNLSNFLRFSSNTTNSSICFSSLGFSPFRIFGSLISRLSIFTTNHSIESDYLNSFARNKVFNSKKQDFNKNVNYQEFLNTTEVKANNINIKEAKIIDKKEEQRSITPGKTFNVERTISTNTNTELIFAVLFSPGVILKDMCIDEDSILDGTYEKGITSSDNEKRIEKIRKQLPDQLKELEIIGYSKPFIVDGEKTIQMKFESYLFNNLNSNGRISYLVISSDDTYDFESTTHWKNLDVLRTVIVKYPALRRLLNSFLLNMGYFEINAETAKEILESDDNALILDIRNKEDYDAKHINGAVSVTLDDMSCGPCLQNMLESYKNNSIIIYGDNKIDTKQAYEILIEQDYTFVYYSIENIVSWRIAGFNIITSTGKIDLEATIDQSLTNDKSVFLFFYSNGCGFCQKEKPILEELETLYDDEIAFVYVHSNENPTSFENFKVNSYPTMFLVVDQNDDGYIYKNFVGFTEKNTLSNIFDNVLNKVEGFSEKNGWFNDEMFVHQQVGLPLRVAESISNDKGGQVIIKFKEGENLEEKIAFLEDVGFTKSAEVSSENVIAGKMDLSVFEKIKYDDDILMLYPDENFTILLDESLPLVGFDEAIEEFNLTGSGKKICIIDTGIDGAVVPYSYGYDFVNDDPVPDDEMGHGTLVASVINSIAPDAELVVAKVIGSNGVGFESDVLEALEWCIAQNPDVISFSIGSEGTCSGFCDNNFVAGMSNDAVDSGIFVVAASGNDGLNGLKSPACGSKVFSVGATDDNDIIAGFSNVNPTLDMFAPGVDIETKAGGGSGTSLSAPHVSGAALLVLENELLNPVGLKYRLRSTGIPIQHEYNETISVEIPRLDIYNAIADITTMEPYDYSSWWQCIIQDGEEYGTLETCDADCNAVCPGYTGLCEAEPGGPPCEEECSDGCNMPKNIECKIESLFCNCYEPAGCPDSPATFYFNSHSASDWTNPDNMDDGNNAIYASGGTNDAHLFDANSYGGDCSGSITKVELRTKAYVSVTCTGTIRLIAISGENNDRYDHALSTTPTWYTDDITSLEPDGWTWTEIQNLIAYVAVLSLSCGVMGYMWCSIVEIRVTYGEGPNNPPTQSGESPTNTTTNICPIPALYVNCSDSDAGDTMNATWWSNSSESWVQFAYNNSISNPENITQTNTNFSSPGKTYYWSLNLTDGNGGWNNETYHFTTNNEPTQSGESPTNGSTKLSTTPALYVICSDSDSDSMTAHWYYNESNKWWKFATNTSITTGMNITQTNSNFSNHSATYYWSVNLTDGCNWTNATYHFTTYYVPFINFTEPPTPANNTETEDTWAMVNVTVSDGDGDNVSSFIDWDKSLRGYWSMEYLNSTGVYDNSTYDNFANYTGVDFDSGNQTTGIYGSALQFDGDDDYLNVNDHSSLDITGAITIEAWVKDPPLIPSDEPPRRIYKNPEIENNVKDLEDNVNETTDIEKNKNLSENNKINIYLKNIFKNILNKYILYPTTKNISSFPSKKQSLEKDELVKNDGKAVDILNSKTKSYDWYNNSFLRNIIDKFNLKKIQHDELTDVSNEQQLESSVKEETKRNRSGAWVPVIICEPGEEPDIEGPYIKATIGEYNINISVNKAKEMIDDKKINSILIDIRTIGEYSVEHIDGAINIPLYKMSCSDFIRDMLDEYKGYSLILYDNDGSTGRIAHDYLVDEGFKHIYNINGGLNAWKNTSYILWETSAESEDEKDGILSDDSQSPKILDAYVEPDNVLPGDTMLVSVKILDRYGIESVIADMGGIETIELYNVKGNIYQGVWQNKWLVHSTTNRVYITNITATNIIGKQTIHSVQWVDSYCIIRADDDDPNNWDDREYAYDTSTSTNAYYNKIDTDWCAVPLILTFANDFDCAGFRINAKYTSPHFKTMYVELFPPGDPGSQDETWNSGTGYWPNNDYTEWRMENSDTIDKVEIWFELNIPYFFSGREARVYDIQFYIQNPTCDTDPATNVEETQASLEGDVTDDKSRPVEYQFEYGTSGSYGSETSWNNNDEDPFAETVTSLNSGDLYYYRARLRHDDCEDEVNGSGVTFFTIPPAPENLHDTSQTKSSITYTWDEAYNHPDVTVKTKVLAKTSGYPSSYSDPTADLWYWGPNEIDTESGLDYGQKYYVRAWTYATEAEGRWNETPDSDIMYTRPGDPTLLNAYNPTSSSIDLTWTLESGHGGSHVMIRRKTTGYPSSPTDGQQAYYGVDNPPYTDDNQGWGLAPGITYYYCIWVYDSESGLYSSGLQGKKCDSETTLVEPPTVVTQSATSVEETTATLRAYITATGGQNPDRYIEWDTYGSSFTNNESCGSGGVGTYSKGVSGLSNGTRYHFRGLAGNSAGWGNGTNLSFRTKPQPPSDFGATAMNKTLVNLSWENGNGYWHTVIIRKNDSAPTSRTDYDKIVYNGTGTSCNDSDLAGFKTYHYRAWSITNTAEPEVQYSDPPDPTASATTWSPKTILAKGDAYELVINGTTLYGYLNNTLIVNTSIDENWHHVAFTYNGSTARLYVDGNLNDTNITYNEPIKTNSNNLQIGNDLTGDLDEVRVWSRALGWEEINVSYNASSIPQYEHNFTGLTCNNYSYYAHAIDKAGNENTTETRYFNCTNNCPTAPTNGAPTANNLDDGDNCYAQIEKWYNITVKYTDNNGYTDLNYVELRLLNQSDTTRAIFRYTESGVFSQQDSLNKFEFNTSGSVAEESDNNITVHWHFKPHWSAEEETNYDVQCYCMDDTGLSDNDTTADQLDVITNLLTASIECNDTTEDSGVDRVSIDTSTQVNFTIRYADDPGSSTNSSSYPPDDEFDSVSLYNSSDFNWGTNSSITDGNGTIAFTPTVIGIDNYTLYITMTDGDYTPGEETDPYETIIVDRVNVTNISVSSHIYYDGLRYWDKDTPMNLTYTAVLDYDGTNFSTVSGTLNAGYLGDSTAWDGTTTFWIEVNDSSSGSVVTRDDVTAGSVNNSGDYGITALTVTAETHEIGWDWEAPSVSTTGESESSDYLHAAYGTGKQGVYGSGMGASLQSYNISGTTSDSSGSGMASLADDTNFGNNPSNGGNTTNWWFIYQIDQDDNGDVTVTYTGTDNVGNTNTDNYTFYEDNSDPTLTDAMSDYSELGDTEEVYGDDSNNIVYFSNSFDSSANIYINATGTDNGKADVRGIDFGSFGADNPAEDTSSPYTGIYTINDDDSSGSITVIIYDNVNNSDSGSITCTEDATNPDVNITDIPDGTTGPTNLTGNATDNIMISNVSLYIKNVTGNTHWTGSEWSSNTTLYPDNTSAINSSEASLVDWYYNCTDNGITWAYNTYEFGVQTRDEVNNTETPIEMDTFTLSAGTNEPPYATNLQIHSYNDFTLNNLNTTWTFNDNESDGELDGGDGHTYEWYEGPTSTGSWTTMGFNTSSLDKNYTNESKYYYFSVLPRDDGGSTDGNTYNSTSFQVTSLNETAGVYSDTYTEAGNLTIGNNGVLTISGIASITGNLTIEHSGNLDLGDNNHDIGSLTVDSTSTCTGTSGKLFITNENTTSTYAIDLDGTYTNSSGLIQINTTSATEIDLIPTTGTIYDLNIKSGSTVDWNGNTMIGNNLNITSGTLQPNTATDTITVTNNATINGGTLGGNTASGYWKFFSLYQTSGTITATKGNIYITGEINNFAIDLTGTYTNNSGVLQINTTSATEADLTPTTGTIANLNINSGSTVDWNGTTMIGNNLNITSGTLQPNGASDTLTVTNNATIAGGTLGGNSASGDWEFGSLYQSTGTITATTGNIYITGENNDYAIDLEGTYTNNSGLIQINTTSATEADLVATGDIFDLNINSGSTVDWDGNTMIGDDLSISSGTFRPNSASDTIDVTDDVTVSGGILGGNSASGTWTLGSLTQSSGTIDATTGTIIILSETAGGYALDLDGTLTANTGTIEINTNADTNIDIGATGDLYKLIVDTSDYTVTSDAAATVSNNLTIQAGQLEITNSLTVAEMDINNGGEFEIKSDSALTMTGLLYQNGFFNITLGNATDINLSSTKFDLNNASQISLHDTPSDPSDPSGWTNVNQYVNLTEIDSTASIDINITYFDSDLGSITESTLVMKEYNWSTDTWSAISNTGVNTAANYVWGNSITDFSIFGPLGQEPAANTPPWIKDNTNTPANNTNNICPIPSLHVICWDNNTIDTTNATWRSNSSGPWVSFHTTSTISNNTNITATNGNFTQSNTTYWWSVNLTDGEGGWDNKTFSFTTNQKPEQANIDPWNGSTDISTTPALYVVVSDSDGDTMIAYWRYNDSNNWWTFATNTSITTITNITQTNSNFTNYSTTYYWTVNLTDGCNYTNETYHFTTTASPASLPVVITNASTGIGETNATLNAYLSSNGSADTTCGFRFGTSSGVYTENVSLGVTANLSEFSNNNQSLSKGQIYFFQAWATNSVGFANGGELTFLTKPDPTTSLSAQTNSSSMIYLTWTKPGEANTTYIERNATAVTSWARGEGTLVYNGTATNLEDSGLVNGTTYYYQAWSFANWTYNPTLTQFSDSNDSDNTTTKYHPDLSSETPTNASTGISLNPTLQITVSHNNGYLMNVSWYWGTDNSCPNYIGANNSVTNGTWNMTDSDNNFSSNGVTYYWCVKVNDGHGGWTNETYHFTTIGANKQIISKGQSAYSLEMNSGGTTLYGYINSNAVNISIDTNWHYVVLTFDGTTIKLYKDGELVDSKGLSASINTNNNDLKLGEFFTGTLDELRVSNTARNAGYINTTYNNENSPTTFATFGDQIGVLSTWDYRKKIWINASQIENDLPYFPVLISTTDNDLKNNAHLTGNDIIFMNTTAGWTTSSYTGRFPHEVEKWDKSNGELVAWVNVTSLSSTTNTSIYMYYGSSICTSDRTNANGVWDSNYVMVQHLNETSDPHGDSTSYNNDGNESGGVNQSADEEKIDGADWFDGNNDYVDCGNGTSLNIRNAVTIEAWIKMDERPDQEDWYDCTGKGNYSLYLYGVDNTETIIGAYFWIDGVEVDLWEEGVVDINPNNGWAHCVITFDGTDIKAYVNGQLDFTYNNPGTIDDSSAINLIIGAWDEANHFYGSLDEVRISNTNRSAAWINTTYNNTNDPSSFLAFGEQEIQNVAPTQSSPSPSDGATGQSLNPPLQITIADNNVDSMNVTFRTNASGPWADIDSNNTVFNGTYQQTPSNMNSYNTKYWWSANVTDGTLWNNVTYNFTTNALPVLSNPIPANGSSGISLWPACNVTVSDANGGTVDVYFYENTTGTWICNQTNSSVDVTTAQNVVWVNYSNASSSSTEYWWSVNVTDSIGWTNETYSFTTAASPFLYVFERYRFIKLSDFLPEATDKEKEYIQHIDITDKTEITNGKIRLKITEELEETTYLDRIYLRINGEQIVEIDNIKPKTQQLKPLAEQSFLSQTNKQLLKHSDNHYLILKEGDEYILEFVIPDNCHKIEFAAEGYYIEHHTHKNDR